MKRTLLRVGALLGALALLFVPVLAGMIPSSTSSTPDPVTQDTTDNSGFFSAQNPAPGLTQTATAPMTRTRGS